jgi:hypothetical protein
LIVPDEGYSLIVPDEGYSLIVPDEDYSLIVPDKSCSTGDNVVSIAVSLIGRAVVLMIMLLV